MSEALEGAPLTDGEVKAFRLGVLRGIELCGEQLEHVRIRVAGKSLEVDPPLTWPALRRALPPRKKVR